MQKHRDITRNRFSKLLGGGTFGDVSLVHFLTPATEGGHKHVKLWVYSVPDLKRVSFAEAVKGLFVPAKVGDSFGPTWSTHWFKVQLEIPREWVGEEVEFRWDAGCEGMLWSTEGVPIHGLIAGTRVEYILTRKSKGGEKYEFYVELACNELFGAGEGGLIQPPNPSRRFRLSRAHLAINNVTARELWRDFEIIRGMVDDLPVNSQRGAQALTVANQICNTFDRDDVKSLDACRALSKAFLNQGSASTSHVITAVGNCHIDTAWLWPFDETKRKVARSWSTQVRLLEQYPEFTFAASQAQQFKWLKELYPEVFQQVQAKAQEGRFIPIGGTWVEMDCNMPSGEALVRQFMFGQRFFEKHFGKRCKVFWLPDTFGYSAQLPQIVRQADMRYFFTQKLSWNNINKFPNTTFYWEGLDGSRVLTHMAPSETYAAQGNVSEVIKSVENHKDLPYTNESMLLYGNGDGGGGPLPAMVDRLLRLQNIDGLPRVKFGDPNEFYERVEANSPDLVTWKGELYFELHRGTYTSQSEVKHANRRSEFLLREVEAVASLAAVRSPANYTYPQEEINRLWELVLLNQFHDVLPGSSIEMVYQDAHKFYKQVETQATQLLSYALQVLHGVDPTGAPASLAEFGPHQSGQGDAAPTVLTFNSLPWPRTAVVEVPLDVFPDQVQQVASSGQVGYTLAQNVPSFGPLMLTPNQVADIVPVSAYATKDGQYVLENLYVVATFDRGGRLVSLVDRKVERELIPKGVSGNLFRLYEDIPIYWDAWDVEVYHLEKGRDCPPGTVRVSEEGPLLGALEVTYQLSPNSKCTQIISLSAASPRLDFACDVDWHENRRILKVEFTVDILSDVATYETQFGWVQRPTHYNTTWDMAKFEVCGHKFADLSEFGYGVALLNDSKYGYSTYKNTMRLSLLRAPKAPDAHCDMGRHQFRYALYPHQGTFFESDVVQQGYEFNVPLLQHVAAAGLVKPNGDGGGKDSALPSTFFEWVGDRNIILDTVKKAEDSDALILRFYEAYGGQGRGHLRTPLKIAQAHVCNLLEDEQRALVWDAEKGLALTLKPFQILTLKVGVKA